MLVFKLLQIRVLHFWFYFLLLHSAINILHYALLVLFDPINSHNHRSSLLHSCYIIRLKHRQGPTGHLAFGANARRAGPFFDQNAPVPKKSTFLILGQGRPW